MVITSKSSINQVDLMLIPERGTRDLRYVSYQLLFCFWKWPCRILSVIYQYSACGNSSNNQSETQTCNVLSSLFELRRGNWWWKTCKILWLRKLHIMKLKTAFCNISIHLGQEVFHENNDQQVGWLSQKSPKVTNSLLLSSGY